MIGTKREHLGMVCISDGFIHDETYNYEMLTNPLIQERLGYLKLAVQKKKIMNESNMIPRLLIRDEQRHIYAD